MYSRAPISFKIQKFRRAHINFFLLNILSDGLRCIEFPMEVGKISTERRFPFSSDP